VNVRVIRSNIRWCIPFAKQVDRNADAWEEESGLGGGESAQAYN
jgi:hypothetical protein